MNSDFLKSLDAFDDASTTRRDALRKAGRLGANVALAALPFYASAKNVMAKSYGASFETDVDILNYALTLEYLEYYFYLRAVGGVLNAGTDDEVEVPAELVISDPDARALFQGIRDNEAAHVQVLTEAVTSLEGTPVSFPLDAFTYELAPGVSVYDSYDDFLLLSQAFEDTGVRAYKGQAADISSPAILTAALQIHSVEARHAAAVRRLRGNQGWIPLNQPSAPAAIQPVYAGEDNVTQGGVDLASALPDYTAEQISEAFDEPLDSDAVLAIAGPFITAP